MIVTRKLFIPTLGFFALVLIALAGFYSFSMVQTFQQEEARELERLSQYLENQIENMKDLSVGLAMEMAANPEVQAAFADGDRPRLTELTLTSYQQLNQQFDIPEFQFHQPPATTFLRLHETASYGDDQSSNRTTVVAANGQRRSISGLEVSKEGLAMRGIVPVSYEGKHVGTVEVGLNIDRALIVRLKQEFGADWQVMTLAGTGGITEQGPTSQLNLRTSTLGVPIFAQAEVYEEVLKGKPQTTRVQTTNRAYALRSIPLHDYSGRVIGVADVLTDRTAVLAGMQLRLGLAGAIILLSLATGALWLRWITRRTLLPIEDLTRSAAAIAAGDLSQEVQAGDSQDEIGILASSFKSMSRQLRELMGNLEQHVTDRTRTLERRSLQLETASEVARDISNSNSLEEMTRGAVQQICARFGFSYGAIYLLDELGEYAHLQAVSGEPTNPNRASSLKLRVGQDDIIASAITRGETRVSFQFDSGNGLAAGSGMAPSRFDGQGPELALPLKVGGAVIGALGLQAPAAQDQNLQAGGQASFGPEDLTVLETLADQLATAIENRRLVEKLEKAVQETNSLYQSQVREGWAAVTPGLKATAYEYDRRNVQAIDPELPAEWRRQLQGGKSVILPGKDGSPRSTLLVPVTLRDQIIGVISLEEDDPNFQWSADEIAIVEAAASQAALTLENARLLEETQHQAEREQMIGQIAARVRETLDIDTVLRTTLQELGSSLDVSEVEVRIGQPQLLNEA